MISEPIDHIKKRAERWIEFLGQGELVEGRSTIGGGSLPGETLPTWLVGISVAHPNMLLSSLRGAQPPIIARLEEDRLVLDPRTILLDQEERLLTNLRNILSS
jgi:L-seryl-tRNA(Ser) seleniumtransferase